ncbi:TPA: DUF2933 domain-containing protein [Burkholderia vietnamiensis]|nr:DUF2933 domain-containing protein [Burkholderia vietnamiensis]
MDDDSRSSRPFWKSRAAIAWLVFGAIAMFLLLSEHRAHFLGVLPYLLLFSCPLMHLFMHHGHHHHGEGKDDTHADSGENHARHG